jgi:hypothetical protein
VITTEATSEAARIKSYQLFAREFELTPEYCNFPPDGRDEGRKEPFI